MIILVEEIVSREMVSIVMLYKVILIVHGGNEVAIKQGDLNFV